jgi:hypothetical protein
MDNRPQTQEGRFVEVSWGFHGVPLGFRVFFLVPRRSRH